MEDKTSKTSQPATIIGTSIASPSHQRSLVKLAIVAVVVLVCIVGVLIYRHEHKPKGLSYTYSNLSEYTLSGTSAGHGMSFELPQEFLSSPKPKSTSSTFRTFYDLYKINGDKGVGTIGSVVANSSVIQPSVVALTKSLYANLNKPQSAAYEAVLASLKNKISVIYPTFIYNLQVTKLAPFTNANIKSNAWYLDFSITSKSTKTKPLLYSGELFYGIGASTSYSLMAATVNYNWTDNSSVWQNVFNSIKIDQ